MTQWDNGMTRVLYAIPHLVPDTLFRFELRPTLTVRKAAIEEGSLHQCMVPPWQRLQCDCAASQPKSKKC